MLTIIPHIIVFLFTGYILYGIFLLISNFFVKLKERIALGVSAKIMERDDDLEKYLLHHFSYYDRLPETLKVKFLLRVKNFIRYKSFEGREGLVITNEMKSWVAASAVQLTFGLHKYSLERFTKIILYPEAFYNRRNDAMHMGETNMNGVIVLSWKDLQEGFEKSSDNFNVGLHEMAHALELQLLLNDDYDEFFGNYYAKFCLIAEDEYENIGNEGESFLRKYAGVNRHEFFAVCIEYFFESSTEFREKLPEIYYHLSILLNQDPLHDDAHVDETARKSESELENEISAQAPILIPKFSIMNLGFHFLYFIFIFSMLVVQGFKGTPTLLYFSIVVAAFSLLMLYYRMNKFVLYENCLLIKNPFGKTKGIYELDDIVAVKLSRQEAGDSLEILRARHGRINSVRYGYTSNENDTSQLLQKLKEKKIVIR